MTLQDETLKLKFDSAYQGKLFSAQGDTGRIFNIQILSELNNVVDVTGMKLRLYVGDSEEVIYSEGEIVKADEGRFKVEVFNSQLKNAGIHKAQFVLFGVDDKQVGSKVFDLYVEESIENGATVGKNIIVDFSKIDEAVKLLKDYDKTLQEAKETDLKLKVDIDTGTELNNSLNKNIEIVRTFDFDGDIQKAKETRDDLVVKTTAGEKTKSDLDGSITTANQTKTGLDGSISTGQGLNDSLSSKIRSATIVDGQIKSKMDTVQGWIDNPLQFKGDKGDRGDVGPKGETGDPGPKGDPGKTGVIGPQGPQGEPGPMGQGLTILGRVSLTTDLPSVGDNGDAYFVGTHLYVWTGSKWEDMGEVKGDKGDAGPQGLKGEDGKQGPPGPKGEDGKPGVDGRQGIDGKPGKDGVSVTHSWSGTTLNVTSASGTSSADLKGPKGDRGATGPKGDPATNLVKSVQGKTGEVMLTKADITALGIPAQDTVYDDTAIIAEIEERAYKTELPTKLSHLVEDRTHRTVTDTEKRTWSGKQDPITKESVKALGFPEHVVLTQTQYDALSSTQKADSTVFYYIKKA